MKKAILAILAILALGVGGIAYYTHKEPVAPVVKSVLTSSGNSETPSQDKPLGYGNPTIITGGSLTLDQVTTNGNVTANTITVGGCTGCGGGSQTLAQVVALGNSATGTLQLLGGFVAASSTVTSTFTVVGGTLLTSGTSTGIFAFQTVTSTLANIFSLNVSGTIDTASGANLTCAGKDCLKTLALSAAGCNIPNAGGAATSSLDYYGANVVRDVYFQPLAYGTCQAQWTPPASWDGTLSAAVEYSVTTTDANGVTWGVQAQGMGNGSALNTAFSAATATVTTVASTTNSLVFTSSTSVTVGGSTVNPEVVNLRVTRSNVGASTNTAALLFVVLKYGVNKLTD